MATPRASRAPLFSLVRIARPIMLLAVLAVSSSAYQILSPFWISQIDSALRVRDGYYKTILPDTSNFSLILLSAAQQSELCERLTATVDTTTPWHDFCAGILSCNQKKIAASGYFASALARTHADPGATWALFVEFTRNRQTIWAERCLMHLEKLLLTSGAREAPAIAQQLLFYAASYEKQKDYENAFSYYAWAERFDPNQPWSLLHRMRNCIPMHPMLFFASFGSMTKALYNSWILQLTFAANLYTWIRYFLLVIMVAVFVGTGFRHLPKAVHFLADRLPKNIPATLKTVLPIGVIFSFLAFGIVPFLWLLAFLVWRWLDKREKLAVLCALILLVCSPFDARLQDMFIQARQPQGSISLYARASQEGYSAEVQRLALGKVTVDRSDMLAHMAASLSALKQGDTTASIQSIQKAAALRPSDPVVLLTAGNAAFAANDLSLAAQFYQQVINARSNEMNARFNLAQCSSRKSDTATDLDFMKILPVGEQNAINTFVNANNMYFSKNWPTLRQFMTPDYQPAYFWLHIFPSYNGSWETARNPWGGAFLGLSPRGSLAVFAALLVILFAWNLTPAARKRKNLISACRLCKRVVCNKCRKNELCSSCVQATQYIRNVKTLANIQANIKRNAFLSLRVLEYVLDICIPGSGMLAGGRHPFWLSLFIIMVTGVVYASFFLLSAMHLGYPHWVAYGVMDKAPYFFALYNLLFAGRALWALVRRQGRVLT
jgi:tetratricopeptide (TPR) repeat protein